MAQRKRCSWYLSSASGDRCPKRWAILSVDCQIGWAGDPRGRPELRLRKWHLWYWKIHPDWTSEPIKYAGATAEGFWYTLDTVLAGRGTVVCLCADAIQALTVLDAWGELDERNYLLCKAPLILADPPTAIKLRCPGLPGRLLLLDARNYGLDVPPGTEGMERLMVVAYGLPGMLRSLALGSLQPTAGAQAMHAYRRSYLSTPIYLHCRQAVLDLEQEAIHGGRAECYRLGRVDGPVYELDFSGFYGSIMNDSAVPTRLRRFGEQWKPYGLAELENGYGVVARVKVKTEWPYLPCQREGLTVFPVGTWWTVLCGSELVHAYLSGNVVDVGNWASYEMGLALRHYARRLLSYCYGEHRNPVADMRSVGKALLVSLVGKFAQRLRRWEDRPQVKGEDRWSRWYHVDTERTVRLYRSVAGRVQRQLTDGFAPLACPQIAAWIYSEGRMVLWRAQLVAGREEVYYCHTDSLFVSQLGYQRLCEQRCVADGVPGKLSVKGKHNWIELYGISHYRTPTKSVCAGVVGSAEQGQPESVPGYYAETVTTALASNRPPLPILYPSAGEHVQPYRHGVRESDGSVSPWRMEDHGER